MESRVKTGISGLDDLLSGGLPAGGTYAVVGEAGTGKTILSLEYVYNGAVKFDEPGVYILIEEQKARFMENMASLGFDLKKLEDEGKLIILPFTKSIMGDIEASFENEILAEDTSRIDRLRQFLTVDTVFKHIKETVEKIGAKRIVIDSMTMLTLLSQSQLNARLQVMWLIEKLHKLNVTTMVTLEEGISLWKDIPFLCDGIMNLILKEKEGIFQRGIVVEKMRGADHDTGVRPLKIVADEGIRIYTDELVYKPGSSEN